MSFSFCLNKFDLLAVCGTTLLYQLADLKPDSKMMRDSERLVNAVISILTKAKAPGATDLARVARSLISVDGKESASPAVSSRKGSMPAPSQRPSPLTRAPSKKSGYAIGQLYHSAASEDDLIRQQEKMRRMTMAHVPTPDSDLYRSRSRQSFDSLSPESATMSHHDYGMPKAHSEFGLSVTEQYSIRNRTVLSGRWPGANADARVCLSGASAARWRRYRKGVGSIKLGMGGAPGLDGWRTEQRLRRYLRWL